MHEHCQVCAMTESDLPMVLEWRNHPDIRRFMFTQHKISLAEHSQWFDNARQDNTRRLLIVKERTDPIGYVQFSGVDAGGIADWGFFAPPGAAKGTGRKLGSTALQYAFDQLNLHKVCGQAIDSNLASIILHERLGFKREAELRDQKRIGTRYHTLICFGLLADEWQAHIKEDKL